MFSLSLFCLRSYCCFFNTHLSSALGRVFLCSLPSNTKVRHALSSPSYDPLVPFPPAYPRLWFCCTSSPFTPASGLMTLAPFRPDDPLTFTSPLEFQVSFNPPSSSPSQDLVSFISSRPYPKILVSQTSLLPPKLPVPSTHVHLPLRCSSGGNYILWTCYHHSGYSYEGCSQGECERGGGLRLWCKM